MHPQLPQRPDELSPQQCIQLATRRNSRIDWASSPPHLPTPWPGRCSPACAGATASTHSLSSILYKNSVSSKQSVTSARRLYYTRQYFCQQVMYIRFKCIHRFPFSMASMGGRCPCGHSRISHTETTTRGFPAGRGLSLVIISAGSTSGQAACTMFSLHPGSGACSCPG